MNTSKAIKKYLGWSLIICLALQALGCSSLGERFNRNARSPSVNIDQIPDAVPKPETYSRKNNPSSYVVRGKRYYVLKTAKGYDKVGYASWYGSKFHGQRTSSDESYNMFSMTAASTTLPIPSYVRVTNLDNNRSVVVKVNDRGPFRSDRLIDLSYAAAKKLGYSNIGTAHVRVTAADAGTSSRSFFADNQTEDKTTPAAVGKVLNAQFAENKVPSTVKVKPSKNSHGKSALYLQVGSYKSHDKALGVSKQLASLTRADVAIKEGYHRHNKVYRVHIGPLANNGVREKKILSAHGFDEYLVIKG